MGHRKSQKRACCIYGGSKHPGEMPFLRAPNLLGSSPSVSEPGPAHRCVPPGEGVPLRWLLGYRIAKDKLVEVGGCC